MLIFVRTCNVPCGGINIWMSQTINVFDIIVMNIDGLIISHKRVFLSYCFILFICASRTYPPPQGSKTMFHTCLTKALNLTSVAMNPLLIRHCVSYNTLGKLQLEPSIAHLKMNVSCVVYNEGFLFEYFACQETENLQFLSKYFINTNNERIS